MQLTKSQQSLFWRTFAAACRTLHITTEDDKTAYRKRVITETTSQGSLKDVNRTTDFEALIVRLALDSGDYEMAIRWDSGQERRWAYMVEICAIQLTQLIDDQPTPLAYVIGILNQAGYQGRFNGDVWWLDLTADRLQSLFQMLDTHRRRLLRRSGSRHLKFDLALSYHRDHAGIFHGSITHYPDSQRLIRVA